ncbi:MAG: ion channel [Burkholderiales bacterium]
MITAIILSVLLVSCTSAIHFEALTFFSLFANRFIHLPRFIILSAMLFLPMVHVLEITLYAAVYYYLTDTLGLGTFSGNFSDTFSNYLYYSAETFSSLGFGDILPRGAIRLVTGIEVLNGLLLIAWSGSFVFILMQRYWKIDGSTTHHRSTH